MGFDAQDMLGTDGSILKLERGFNFNLLRRRW
jgi:hypothetical protein